MKKGEGMETARKKSGVVAIAMAALLSLGLMLGGVSSAFAADIPKDGGSSSETITGAFGSGATITKKLMIAPNVEAPDVGFAFDVALKSVSDHADSEVSTNAVYDSVRSWSTAAVNFAGMKNTTGDSMMKQTPANIPAATAFPHAGVYTYQVTEKAVSALGVTSSGENYTMNVYVKNGASTLEVYAVTVILTSDIGDDNKKVDPEPGDDNGFIFVNSYTPTTTLSVQKTTDGDFADRTLSFGYTVTITTPSNTPANSEIRYIKNGDPADSGATVEPIGPGATTKTVTMDLKHEDAINFSGLPAGTVYTVTEAQNPNYRLTASVTEGGTGASNVTVESGSVTVGDSRPVPTNLVATTGTGEKPNVTAVTGTYRAIEITGLVTENLPFILIGAAAIGGLAFFLVSRVRRANEED